MADDELPSLVAGYDEDRRQEAMERFINKRQAASLTESAFGGTGLEDDVQVGVEGKRPFVEKTRSLSDSEFDTFRDTVRGFTTFVRGPGPNRNEVKPDTLDEVPDPREVHESRSEFAQQTDEQLSAPLTNDPEQYARNPDEYDWPGVDTPAESDANDARSLDDLESLF